MERQEKDRFCAEHERDAHAAGLGLCVRLQCSTKRKRQAALQNKTTVGYSAATRTYRAAGWREVRNGLNDRSNIATLFVAYHHRYEFKAFAIRTVLPGGAKSAMPSVRSRMLPGQPTTTILRPRPQLCPATRPATSAAVAARGSCNIANAGGVRGVCRQQVRERAWFLR